MKNLKKSLALMLSLILCLAPCFFLTACKKEKEPTELEVAIQRVQTAINNIKNKEALEFVMTMEGEDVTIILDGEVTYMTTSMMGTDMQVWTITEDGVTYDYTVAQITDPKPMVVYSKQISEGPMMSLDDITMDSFENVSLISSTKEAEIETIVFKYVEEDVEMFMTVVIENDILVSMVGTDAEENIMASVVFNCEDVVVPALPTEDANNGGPIDWTGGSL